MTTISFLCRQCHTGIERLGLQYLLFLAVLHYVETFRCWCCSLAVLHYVETLQMLVLFLG